MKVYLGVFSYGMYKRLGSSEEERCIDVAKVGISKFP